MIETIIGFLGIGGLLGAGVVGLLPFGLGALGIGATILGFFRGGFRSPIFLMGVVVVLMAGVTYHFVTVANWQTKVAETMQQIVEVKNENSALKIDKFNLLTSNQSLEQAIAVKDRINKELIASIEKLQKDDDEIEAKLRELHAKINSDPTLDTTNDGAIELFVNEANKDLKCELANFTNFTGSCINGVWVEN